MALQKNITWIVAGCLLLFIHHPHFHMLFALGLFEKLVITYSAIAFSCFLHRTPPPSMMQCYIVCDQLLFSNLKHGIIHYALSTAAFLGILFLSQALLFSPIAAVAAGQIIVYASLLRIAYYRAKPTHSLPSFACIPASRARTKDAKAYEKKPLDEMQQLPIPIPNTDVKTPTPQCTNP